MEALREEKEYTIDDIYALPDWIIEIVSPGSKSRDFLKKMLRHGTM